MAGGFDLLGQPILRIFGLHQPRRSKLALGDHLARLADHRIAGVIVGEHEHLSGPGDQRGELLGVGQSGGQRLVANDVDAGLEEGLGRGEVRVVGRYDGDRLDAVRTRRFGLRHFLERAVAAVAGQAELLRRRLGPCRV